MKHLFSDKGQTLIEVIAAIGIGSIIIVALLSLATRSNRNANFASTSSQATKLSQQGLEIIRNIDSVNFPGAVTRLAACDPMCNMTNIYSETYGNLAGQYNFVLVKLNTGVCVGINESWCLDYGGLTDPPLEEISADLGNFTREVRIEDADNPCNDTLPPTESKLVTVVVRWDDPSGSHDAQVSTCISNL
jgi:hypothetical protein